MFASCKQIAYVWVMDKKIIGKYKKLNVGKTQAIIEANTNGFSILFSDSGPQVFSKRIKGTINKNMKRA